MVARERTASIGAVFNPRTTEEMCSGSEAGSHLRCIDFVYHSTLGLRVNKKQKKKEGTLRAAGSFSASGLHQRLRMIVSDFEFRDVGIRSSDFGLVTGFRV